MADPRGAGGVVFPGAVATDGTWVVPAGWTQGRGAWGGLVVATAVRAAEAAEVRVGPDSPGRGVRTLTVQMMAPVPDGPVPVAVRELRRGSATAMWRVEVGSGQGGQCAEAAVVLGDPRAADVPPVCPAMPDVAPWEQAAVIEVGPPIGPEFAPHLEFRPVAGYPYSGRTDDVISWIRPRGDGGGGYDAGALLGLVDALWPGTLIHVTTPRPMATLTFTATLLVDPATVPVDEPLLHIGRMVASAGGYVTETRELWTPDGRLAVHNTQVITIIR